MHPPRRIENQLNSHKSSLELTLALKLTHVTFDCLLTGDRRGIGLGIGSLVQFSAANKQPRCRCNSALWLRLRHRLRPDRHLKVGSICCRSMANQTNHSKFNTGPDFDSPPAQRLQRQQQQQQQQQRLQVQLKLSSLGKRQSLPLRAEPMNWNWAELNWATDPPSHRSLPKFDFFLLLCARFCAPSNAGDSLSDYYQIALAHFWLSSRRRRSRRSLSSELWALSSELPAPDHSQWRRPKGICQSDPVQLEDDAHDHCWQRKKMREKKLGFLGTIFTSLIRRKI